LAFLRVLFGEALLAFPHHGDQTRIIEMLLYRQKFFAFLRFSFVPFVPFVVNSFDLRKQPTTRN
jgi:hypothetical protein